MSTWSVEEEICLCHAWVGVQGHPELGVDYTNFWPRVLEDFQKRISSMRPTIESSRTQKACQHKFSSIHNDVCKFVTCLSQVQNASGNWEPHEVQMEKAGQIYAHQGVDTTPAPGRRVRLNKFKYEHCLEILLKCPKWQSMWKDGIVFHPRKKREIPDGSEDAGSSKKAANVVPAEAPTGVKHVKRLQLDKSTNRSAIHELLEVQKGIAISLKQQADICEREYGLKLFSIDLSSVEDPEAKRFFQLQRHKVLRKLEADEEANNRTNTVEVKEVDGGRSVHQEKAERREVEDLSQEAYSQFIVEAPGMQSALNGHRQPNGHANGQKSNSAIISLDEN